MLVLIINICSVDASVDKYSRGISASSEDRSPDQCLASGIGFQVPTCRLLLHPRPQLSPQKIAATIISNGASEPDACLVSFPPSAREELRFTVQIKSWNDHGDRQRSTLHLLSRYFATAVGEAPKASLCRRPAEQVDEALRRLEVPSHDPRAAGAN